MGITTCSIFFLLLSFVQFPQSQSLNNDPPVDQRIELLGSTELSGSALDKSGLDNSFDAVSCNNMLGGFSGIAYSGKDDIYYVLSDRGPQDGAVDWSCRVQKIRISISNQGGRKIKPELLESILLEDETGKPFTGLASAFRPTVQGASLGPNHSSGPSRFDPEGIRVGNQGQLFISDEYGPRVIEFTAGGKMTGEIAMPDKLLIDSPGINKSEENRQNDFGRQSNRGMEGLAISQDRQTLYGLIQSPLLQDSMRTEVTHAMNSPKSAGHESSVTTPVETVGPQQIITGLNCRLLQFSVLGEHQKEMLYHLDQSANKLNEILAVDEDQFVVIERDGLAGVEARFKKIMLISTKNATDISAIEQLPPQKIPPTVTPIEKRVLIDLLDPRWDLAGEKMPEKIEGLAFGPRLPDGRRILIVTSDNDFELSNPSQFYVFAIPGI